LHLKCADDHNLFETFELSKGIKTNFILLHIKGYLGNENVAKNRSEEFPCGKNVFKSFKFTYLCDPGKKGFLFNRKFGN
jgi:hypothetical protein